MRFFYEDVIRALHLARVRFVIVGGMAQDASDIEAPRRIEEDDG